MDKSERFQEKRQGLDREEIPVFRLTNATVDTRMSLDEQVIASTRHRYEALRVPLNSRGISSLRQRAMTGPAHLVSASSNAVANLGLQDGPPTRAGGGAATQDSEVARHQAAARLWRVSIPSSRLVDFDARRSGRSSRVWPPW